MGQAATVGNFVGLIAFVVWVSCLYSWIKRGVSIPRYVRVLAFILTCVSVGCMIVLGVAGLATFRLILAFLFIPSAATYFLWFWLFGPELTDKGKKGT